MFGWYNTKYYLSYMIKEKKKENKVVVTAKIHPLLKKAVVKKAKTENRTFSNLVETLLLGYVEQF